MPTDLPEIPAVFVDQKGQLRQVPIDMIGAYVPEASYLDLEKAARVASIRDEDLATNIAADVLETFAPPLIPPIP